MANKIDNKLRVIMAGPLPPLIGGMATVIEDISNSSLPNRVQLELFNTGKETKHRQFILFALINKLSLWKKWISTVGGSQPTIVHIHTCSGWSFFLDGVLLLISTLYKRPSIIHIHGAQFDIFLDNLPAPSLWMARRIFKLATRVVVLSEEWNEKLSKRLPRVEFTVIKNGVPVPDNKAIFQDKNTITILFLGNLSKRKGIWDLVEAMKAVPPPIQLILAGGEDEPDIGKKINEEVKRLDLVKRVKWLGPVHGEDKVKLLLNADIFVLPSYAEGLPISLLEAMCAGLPVIATPVGGIPTVVKQNEQGLLVEPGDVENLTKALTTLATSPQLRQEFGSAARTTCKGQYSIESVVGKYMDLYIDISKN